MSQDNIDLTAQRDLRVAPVARQALAICLDKKASLLDVPEASIIKEVTELILTEVVSANLMRSEVTWLKTLLVQAIANSVVSTFSGDGIESGDEKYEAAAYALLTIIVTNQPQLGMIRQSDVAEIYAPMGKELTGKIKELGLNAVEVDHVFGLLTKMTSNIGNNVEDSVTKASQLAEQKLFGVDDMDNVTVGQIIDIQKK